MDLSNIGGGTPIGVGKVKFTPLTWVIIAGVGYFLYTRYLSGSDSKPAMAQKVAPLSGKSNTGKDRHHHSRGTRQGTSPGPANQEG